MLSEPEPEPEPETKAVPKTKGEARREHILQAIHTYIANHQDNPQIQDIQQLTGLRSFNTLTSQLKILRKEGIIDWDNVSPYVKLASDKDK
jgi:SOS-response transcriptional repressor LexA